MYTYETILINFYSFRLWYERFHGCFHVLRRIRRELVRKKYVQKDLGFDKGRLNTIFINKKCRELQKENTTKYNVYYLIKCLQF